MPRGIAAVIGWNILSNLLQLFALPTALLTIKLQETPEMPCESAFATDGDRV